MINLAVLGTLLLLAAVATAGNTIYTWTDKDGVRHMSNFEPVDPSAKFEVMELKPTANSGEPRSHYTEPVKPPGSQHETKVTITDNHVIVPVSISYNQKNVQAKLLLDTGSTNITLHKDIAKKLSIKKPQKGSIRVAGGELIDAEAVTLDSITVGPHTKNNLVAGIIEHNGPDVAFDGLLGMNFLRNYQYTIDFEKKVLRWNQ